MGFEYLIDPAHGPRWQALLPGKPQPYVLERGEGEHAMLFTDLFSVLLSGGETEGQLGIITSESPAGDFGYVPAGFAHAYKIDQSARMTGVLSGGFERFFQHMGRPTDHGTAQQPPFVPDFPRMQAAVQKHNMQFMPNFDGKGGAG
jgi:quercetin 2,3-dioxygenase